MVGFQMIPSRRETVCAKNKTHTQVCRVHRSLPIYCLFSMSDSTEQSKRFPREEFSPELSPSSTEGPEIPEKLQCPLCLEWMQTLGQLNRHLDDVHRVHSPTKESPSPGEGLEVPALPPRQCMQSWCALYCAPHTPRCSDCGATGLQQQCMCMSSQD